MTRFTAFVYSIVYLLAMPAVIYRLLRSAGAAQLSERLGFGLGTSALRHVWLHASSVGEVALLEPIVAALEHRKPDTPLLITAYTAAGVATARKRFPAHTVHAFPFDFGFVIRRFLAAFEPRLVVVVESELWPRFLTELRRARVPVAVLNGKISQRSLKVHRLTRFAAQAVRSVEVFAMQDAGHARRMRELGADEAAIHVTGSMKYDLVASPAASPARSDLGIADAAFVVVGGSLHEREDEAFLDAVFSPQPLAERTVALLAPRYPETAGHVLEAARARGLQAVLRSELPALSPQTAGWQVCIVDTLGELRALYALADAVFVGGSLYYRGSTRGGHNLMEPAINGVPVFFGPYNYSFADIASALVLAGGGAEVSGAADLRRELLAVHADTGLAARMGKAARQVVLDGQGAVKRNLELVFALLEQGSH